MYQQILIPTDGSYDARKGAEQGIGLAAALDATVHGLYVVESGVNPWRSESIDEQEAEATEYAEDILADVAAMADDAGIEFRSAVRFGPKVYREINDYVEANDIDLITMGSGYHGEIGGLLGSTADKVLRTAHVPVLVTRRD